MQSIWVCWIIEIREGRRICPYKTTGIVDWKKCSKTISLLEFASFSETNNSPDTVQFHLSPLEHQSLKTCQVSLLDKKNPIFLLVCWPIYCLLETPAIHSPENWYLQTQGKSKWNQLILSIPGHDINCALTGNTESCWSWKVTCESLRTGELKTTKSIS